MQTAHKTQAPSSTYVHPEDKAIFQRVCKAVGYDAGELELVRGAYLRDLESGKRTYAALWDELRPDRFAIMAAQINERIRATITALRREAA